MELLSLDMQEEWADLDGGEDLAQGRETQRDLAGPAEPLALNDETAPNEDVPPGQDETPVDDLVGLYLAEVDQNSLLSAEQEVELAERIAHGRTASERLANNGHDPIERVRLEQQIAAGQEARARLIQANTRLVISIAKRYQGYGLPLLDLIQEGNVGLLKAVDRYDHQRGTRFSTYATWWIRQAVTRALSVKSRIIRIPVHTGDQIRRMYREAAALKQEKGEAPTADEIAQELGTSTQAVHWMMQVSHSPLHLESPVGEDGGDELGDILEDQDALEPSEVVAERSLAEEVERALSELTPREVHILQMRYGLKDGNAHTLQEVAHQFGVSRERVRQIEKEALHKLRHPKHARRLRVFLN